jgi:hypothetical protein
MSNRYYLLIQRNIQRPSTSMSRPHGWDAKWERPAEFKSEFSVGPFSSPATATEAWNVIYADKAHFTGCTIVYKETVLR